MFLKRFALLWLTLVAINKVHGYCKPEEPCWPTKEEIDEFASSLSQVSGDEDCWNQIPTFTSVEDQGDPIVNEWYGDQPDVMTPYALLSLRNFVYSAYPYFVILARNELDVSKSVIFAGKHNISISVLSTGHEFQDRNVAETSLLIRTTCLRAVEAELDPENRFGHKDGVIKLGSGMTWGSSKLGLKGVHEFARDLGRIVVSGHAGHVGVVGWSLGGGHGQLVPLHGMGVDQMLEVELVAADGSYVTANANGTRIRSADGMRENVIDNTDLFWALRGGGGSTWGVITLLTVKLHSPRNSCEQGCYHVTKVAWMNTFEGDDAEMAVNLLHTYLQWSAQASKYWSSYVSLAPDDQGAYYFFLETLYVGTEADGDDINDGINWFSDVYTENIILYENKTYDTFYDKLLGQDPEDVSTSYPMINLVSTLINETMASSYALAEGFVNNWLPRCYRLGTPCTGSYLFMHTMGQKYYQAEGHQDTSISEIMRSATMHVTAGEIVSLVDPELTQEEKMTFVHDVLAPEMYVAGEGSYFSESEYGMTNWKERFWGLENYEKLLAVKKEWDSENVFHCRHCVGDLN